MNREIDLINHLLIEHQELSGYQVERTTRPCQNDIFFLKSTRPGEKSYYLKIFPPSMDEWKEAPAKKLERELVVSELIRNRTSIETPVSMQIHVEGDERLFLLQEELEGVPFDLVMRNPEVPRDTTRRIAWQAGENLAQIHTISSPYFGDILNGEVFSRWAPCFRNEIGKLLESTENRAILNESQIDFFRKKLDGFYIEQDNSGAVLCHRDFTPQNIVINPRTYAIAGILDFEVAKYWKAEWDLTRVNAEFEYPDGNLDLLESFLNGYISHREAVSLEQVREEIEFYKCFESLYYWVWGWDREDFRKDIKYDIVRLTRIPHLS